MRLSGMQQQSRRIDLAETAAVPKDGLLLGWAAMAPFALFAVALWLADGMTAQAVAVAAQLWGGALLLFFSGVRRGLSFRTGNGPTSRQLVTFALLFFGGLAVLIAPPKPALLLVAAAFAALALEDRRAARLGDVPLYFRRLRPPQMTAATGAVLFCWWAV